MDYAVTLPRPLNPNMTERHPDHNISIELPMHESITTYLPNGYRFVVENTGDQIVTRYYNPNDECTNEITCDYSGQVRYV